MNRFPFPAEGEPPLGPIDLFAYIIRMDPPVLPDEPELGLVYKKAIRDFLRLWSVIYYVSSQSELIKTEANSLEKDVTKRPNPMHLLQHPWIKKSESRQVDLARWVAQIWGWPVRFLSCFISSPC